VLFLPDTEFLLLLSKRTFHFSPCSRDKLSRPWIGTGTPLEKICHLRPKEHHKTTALSKIVSCPIPPRGSSIIHRYGKIPEYLGSVDQLQKYTLAGLSGDWVGKNTYTHDHYIISCALPEATGAVTYCPCIAIEHSSLGTTRPSMERTTAPHAG
jgi:hypothetical protein